MIRKKKVAALFLLFLAACGNFKKNSPVESENNIDAVRNFIRAALDGKFNEAKTYMLADSLNLNYLEVAERAYEKADKIIKDGYRTSSIRIFSPITELNDSTSIIIFANSFKNDADTLRVVKTKGQWLVDLKYLYGHPQDNTKNTTQ